MSDATDGIQRAADARRRHRPRRHQDRGDRHRRRAPRARQRAPPDADRAAAPPTSRNAMAAALTEAAKAAVGRARRRCAASASARPGVVDAAAGTVSHADNLPGWIASFPLAAALQSALGTKVVLGNDVGVATDGRVRARRRAARTTRCSASSGAPGVGGGLILDGKPWHGRGGAGEIGHTVDPRGRPALPLRAPRLPRGLRRACGDGGAGAPPARPRREDQALRARRGARPRPADERHLGARARARRQARDEADRPRRRSRSGRGSRPRSTCSTSRPS